MKIQFVKPTAANVNVKATIHINGKLGFSKAATKKFSLDEGKFINVNELLRILVKKSNWMIEYMKIKAVNA